QIWLKKGHASTGPNDANPGLFLMQDSRSRITGLRIRGPSRVSEQPALRGVGMYVPPDDPSFSQLVDNNDISDWTDTAVGVGGIGPTPDCPLNPPSGPQSLHVFRNFIHDNHYGVGTGWDAYPLVFANMFQKNTHSVTTEGSAYAGYVAVANL